MQAGIKDPRQDLTAMDRLREQVFSRADAAKHTILRVGQRLSNLRTDSKCPFHKLLNRHYRHAFKSHHFQEVLVGTDDKIADVLDGTFKDCVVVGIVGYGLNRPFWINSAGDALNIRASFQSILLGKKFPYQDVLYFVQDGVGNTEL